MRQLARISGTVTYPNERNQRLGIPHGRCEIEEFPHADNPAARIWWTDADGVEQTTDLTLIEWAQYKQNKDFVIL